MTTDPSGARPVERADDPSDPGAPDAFSAEPVEWSTTSTGSPMQQRTGSEQPPTTPAGERSTTGHGDGADVDEQDKEARADRFASEHDPARHDIDKGAQFRQPGDWTAQDSGGPQVWDEDGNLVQGGGPGSAPAPDAPTSQASGSPRRVDTSSRPEAVGSSQPRDVEEAIAQGDGAAAQQLAHPTSGPADGVEPAATDPTPPAGPSGQGQTSHHAAEPGSPLPHRAGAAPDEARPRGVARSDREGVPASEDPATGLPGGRRTSSVDEVRDGGYSVGSAAPLADNAMPVGHPVKAWQDTRTYATPDHPAYEQAEPHVWFADAETAQRSGFSPAP